MRKKVCIGIPCYQDVSFETLDDYMRFAFHLGRRCQEHDFFLAIKGKSEQFRARNAIVEAALSYDCDYVFMLDDDHVIDCDKTVGMDARGHHSYDFLKTLIQHLEDDPTKGVTGGLYYQRGGECLPVAMQKRGDGYFLMNHGEISGCLQKVDVVGGGCMVIRKEVFDKIESPWFEPELELGTDIQICKKAAEAGFSVWLDSSIEIGHIKTEREIITRKNLHKFIAADQEFMNRKDVSVAPKLKDK